MKDPNWIIAAASVVNVIVLVLYALWTRGIRKETQRQAERTAELAEQAKDALKLQVLMAYQEEIRALRPAQQSPSSRVRKLHLYQEALARVFPDMMEELLKELEEAAKEVQGGSKDW